MSDGQAFDVLLSQSWYCGVRATQSWETNAVAVGGKHGVALQVPIVSVRRWVPPIRLTSKAQIRWRKLVWRFGVFAFVLVEIAPLVVTVVVVLIGGGLKPGVEMPAGQENSPAVSEKPAEARCEDAASMSMAYGQPELSAARLSTGNSFKCVPCCQSAASARPPARLAGFSASIRRCSPRLDGSPRQWRAIRQTMIE